VGISRAARRLDNRQSGAFLAIRPEEPASRNCSGPDAAAAARFFWSGRGPEAFSRSEIRPLKGTCPMGKGNNAQKNDKKNKKPKQDKTKTPVKK